MDSGKRPIVDVIIPAYNEENAVGLVVQDIPKDLVRHIIVVDNNSSDETRRAAEKAGAFVVDESFQGYGAACLKGIQTIMDKKESPDIIVFIDADYSDFPQEMSALIEPIINDHVDLVIGSRALGDLESGSMTAPQIFGNWLATNLIRIIYGYQFTDLGPFRAIRWDALLKMEMEDRTFGWTAEMQIKAAKMRLKATEIPVTYRKRIGKSKISGTIKGALLAGQKILWTIYKYS